MVNNVTVLGSLNVDTILRIARLPKPGETMPMSDKNNAGGGKGAIRRLPLHVAEHPLHLSAKSETMKTGK